MAQIETSPLPEKTAFEKEISAEELLNEWRLEFPGAKELFSHFEKNITSLKDCQVCIPNNNFSTIKIQGSYPEKIGDDYPAVSLKRWDSQDPRRPSDNCLFTLSSYPSKRLCNENNLPAYRYHLDKNSSEIIPSGSRPDIGDRVSEGYSNWLKKNFIVELNVKPKPV